MNKQFSLLFFLCVLTASSLAQKVDLTNTHIRLLSIDRVVQDKTGKHAAHATGKLASMCVFNAAKTCHEKSQALLPAVASTGAATHLHLAWNSVGDDMDGDIVKGG